MGHHCVRCRSVSPLPRRCCFRPMFLQLLVRENCVCTAHRHTARLTGVHTQKDARGFSSRGCGNRRTQVRQVSKDDMLECFSNFTLNHEGAEIVRNASSAAKCLPVFVEKWFGRSGLCNSSFGHRCTLKASLSLRLPVPYDACEPQRTTSFGSFAVSQSPNLPFFLRAQMGMPVQPSVAMPSLACVIRL